MSKNSKTNKIHSALYWLARRELTRPDCLNWTKMFFHPKLTKSNRNLTSKNTTVVFPIFSQFNVNDTSLSVILTCLNELTRADRLSWTKLFFSIKPKHFASKPNLVHHESCFSLYFLIFTPKLLCSAFIQLASPCTKYLIIKVQRHKSAVLNLFFRIPFMTENRTAHKIHIDSK